MGMLYYTIGGLRSPAFQERASLLSFPPNYTLFYWFYCYFLKAVPVSLKAVVYFNLLYLLSGSCYRVVVVV